MIPKLSSKRLGELFWGFILPIMAVSAAVIGTHMGVLPGNLECKKAIIVPSTYTHPSNMDEYIQSFSAKICREGDSSAWKVKSILNSNPKLYEEPQ